MAAAHPQLIRSPGPAQRHPFRSLAADRRCRALHDDGSDCRRPLLHASHAFCPPHHQEYKQLHESYKHKEKYYSSIELRDDETDAKAKIEAKLAAGKETLQLRDQVNRRFFNFSVRNRGHVKWIMKLQFEVRALERKLAAWEAEESAGSPPQKDAPVSRLLLDPAVPMSALANLSVNSPVVTLRQASDAISANMVEKLYSIALSLDDSSSLVLDDVTRAAREPDDRDFVVRFLFRELLVYKANADVLARAARTQNIDTFLRQSSAQHLEHYIKFFSAFREGRHDTFHLLRDAVCDYLLDLQQPPSSSSTTILGAGIATEDSLRRMDTRGWDILWTDFHDIVEWWNLELFAIKFDDLVGVKALIACHRYGSGDPSDDDTPNWYLPDEDVSQECVLAVMQGFVAVTKGFCDSSEPSAKVGPGIANETQTRCYLVGRMSKKDPLTRRLAQELGERIARFQVLVYDREAEAAGAPGLVSPCSGESPWIRRSRTAPTEEALRSQPWTIEWSLDDVLGDIGLIHDLRDRNMAKDYYEFIIIDRTPGRTFEILDVVADALSKLKGDPPYDEVFRQAIQTYVPAEEQDQYLEAVAHMDFGRPTPPAPHQYLGNRVRCWDVPDTFRAVLQAALQNSSRVITLRESRFISKVAADLESHGVTAQISDYETPRTCPVVMQGVDGLDDLYFHYDMGPMNERAIRGSILDFDPSRSSLVEFAEAYRRAHPRAVFAKGSIKIQYCAWPMPMLAGPRYSCLNFRTPEGRLYRWKALPFDVPMASRVWQLFVDHEINSRLPFVRLLQSTLVVCAEDRDGAKASLKALFDIGEKHEWTFSVPPPASWTTDVKRLGLGSLWEGVRPAV